MPTDIDYRMGILTYLSKRRSASGRSRTLQDADPIHEGNGGRRRRERVCGGVPASSHGGRTPAHTRAGLRRGHPPPHARPSGGTCSPSVRPTTHPSVCPPTPSAAQPDSHHLSIRPSIHRVRLAAAVLLRPLERHLARGPHNLALHGPRAAGR
eukprot:scaffold2799_cov408-Prasinococcus_capsulatus_cf.AAC.30